MTPPLPHPVGGQRTGSPALALAGLRLRIDGVYPGYFVVGACRLLGWMVDRTREYTESLLVLTGLYAAGVVLFAIARRPRPPKGELQTKQA